MTTGRYLLQRIDGAYVARPGLAGSYTRRLELAWRFTTRELADKHRCPENERITTVDEVLGGH